MLFTFLCGYRNKCTLTGLWYLTFHHGGFLAPNISECKFFFGAIDRILNRRLDFDTDSNLAVYLYICVGGKTRPTAIFRNVDFPSTIAFDDIKHFSITVRPHPRAKFFSTQKKNTISLAINTILRTFFLSPAKPVCRSRWPDTSGVARIREASRPSDHLRQDDPPLWHHWGKNHTKDKGCEKIPRMYEWRWFLKSVGPVSSAIQIAWETGFGSYAHLPKTVLPWEKTFFVSMFTFSGVINSYSSLHLQRMYVADVYQMIGNDGKVGYFRRVFDPT